MTNTTKNILIAVLAIIVAGLVIYVAVASTRKDPQPPAEDPIVVVPVPETPTAPITPPQSESPEAPTVTTAGSTVNSSSTANVNGQVRPNGSSTTYWFEYGETTALANKTTAQAIGSGYSSIATPGYITGLKADTTYYFRLSARNSLGTVNGTTYTFRTHANQQPPAVIRPDIRTTAATDVNRTSALLRGQVDPNNLTATYWFEYGKDQNLGYVTVFQTTGNTDGFINVSSNAPGLEPLTKYYYRLNAQNAYGTVTGSVMSFTTGGPANASQPSVTTTSTTSVDSDDATLTGRINPNGDQTKYWFEYSEDRLLGTLVNAGTPMGIVEARSGTTAVRADIQSLKPNTRYYYRLVGQNSYGTVRGDIESFTTRR